MTLDPFDPFFDDDDGPPQPSLPEARALAAGTGKPAKAKKQRHSLCWPDVPPEQRVELQPVTIRQTRQCHFKAKPDGKRGCARCGENKGWDGHVGAPGSFNAFGSGANIHAWQGKKSQWERILKELLEEAGLPKGLGRITVEAVICFGDRTERDQGNFRPVIEKALGDCLVTNGWLYDDDWSRYEFGGLQRADPPDAEPQRYKGENWTELTLFPAWPRTPEEPEAVRQGTLI